MAQGDAYSVTNPSELFKIKYEKKSENVFNTATVLLARIKRNKNFVGRRIELPVPFSFNGGVGSGSTLPTSNLQNYETAVITSKKMYAKILIDRESMKASTNGEGAYEKAQENQVKSGVESFTNNVSRALFAFENGMLGQGDNTTTVTGNGTVGTPYVVRMAAATFVDAFWQEQQLVNVGAETTLLEVVTVAAATRDISLVGTSAILAAATGATATASKIYVQNSKDNDIQSILGALIQTTSTLYGITIGRRWKAYQLLAVASPISTDILNDLVLGTQKQCGKVPNLMITSFKQFRKLLNLLEDNKRYPASLEPRDAKYRGVISYSSISVMTTTGLIPVFPDRHCPDDTFMALNDEYLELHTRGAPSWIDEDGAVLSRSSTTDAFEARYAMYGELYVPPSFHGIITGLT